MNCLLMSSLMIMFSSCLVGKMWLGASKEYWKGGRRSNWILIDSKRFETLVKLRAGFANRNSKKPLIESQIFQIESAEIPVPHFWLRKQSQKCLFVDEWNKYVLKTPDKSLFWHRYRFLSCVFTILISYHVVGSSILLNIVASHTSAFVLPAPPLQT